MNEQKSRRFTPKGILEKMVGRKIDPNLLPAIHKVQIMEYLLTCPFEEISELRGKDIPIFVAICARMLANEEIARYMSVLNRCRLMAREDALNAK